jgi:hypothetical protein
LRPKLFSLFVACVIAVAIQVFIGYDIMNRVGHEDQDEFAGDYELKDFIFLNQWSPGNRIEVNVLMRKLLNDHMLVREFLIHYMISLDNQLNTQAVCEENLERLGGFTAAHRTILEAWCPTISKGNLLPCKSTNVRQIAHSNPEEMLVWMTLKKRFLDELIPLPQN